MKKVLNFHKCIKLVCRINFYSFTLISTSVLNIEREKSIKKSGNLFVRRICYKKIMSIHGVRVNSLKHCQPQYCLNEYRDMRIKINISHNNTPIGEHVKKKMRKFLVFLVSFFSHFDSFVRLLYFYRLRFLEFDSFLCLFS